MRALITLPLGVLQAGSVSFVPEPAAVLAHARRMRMGAALRVTLIFDARFWPDGMSFLFTPQLTPAVWWTSMPERSPIITGWVGGPAAEGLQRGVRAAGDSDALLAICLRSLSSVFRIPEQALMQRLTSWHAHDWTSDPHALGAYSYAPVDAVDASEKMAVPVAGTLYFAGEHTDTTGHWGTVHGALRSGLRAARQILGDE
jgi:monoamine oxidase